MTHTECLQDSSSTVSVAAGRAVLTQSQGVPATLPVSQLTYSPSVTGAFCLSFSVNATSTGAFTAYVQSLADFSASHTAQARPQTLPPTALQF